VSSNAILPPAANAAGAARAATSAPISQSRTRQC
jgi:hypothetical protein